MTRKIIRYDLPNGATEDCIPVPNARLVRDAEMNVFPLFVRTTKNDGVLPEGFEWAETEDNFIGRVVAHSVPKEALNVRIVEVSD